MPELPEVETICRGLVRTVVGRKITNVKVNLPKVINTSPQRFRQKIKNAWIRSVRRRAKIIIINLSNDFSLGIHLKISGQLLYVPKQVPIKKHTHIIFDLGNKSERLCQKCHSESPDVHRRAKNLIPERRDFTEFSLSHSETPRFAQSDIKSEGFRITGRGFQLRFVDTRQFGYIKLCSPHQINEVLGLGKFGPEPLEKSFTRHIFQKLIRRRRSGQIKPLLLNQGFVAGIGNIYADEILFFSRIHPLRRADKLSPKEINNIFIGIKQILLKAIKHKGTSVDSYVEISGRKGNYERFLKVYGREGEGCVRCKTAIKRIKIGSRSAHFCPSCQK